MQTIEQNEVVQKATLAKAAAPLLGRLTTIQKNDALRAIADALIANKSSIFEANEIDLQNGRNSGINESLLDRLALTDTRIEAMADGLRQIAELPDPIGDKLEIISRPNGLQIEKLRVPIGVIGIIYEARPNVTVDAAGLCLKTGNAVILRGGSAALYSNERIVQVLHEALHASGLPADAIQIIMNPERSSVNEMLKLNGLIDVLIPRGGSSLIQNVVQNATVPVIETGAGICHTFIDESAIPHMAAEIAINAKAHRPSVCNAMETLLVHEAYAAKHLSDLADIFKSAHVELRGCEKSTALIPSMKQASTQDWDTEYNDYILNVKIVTGIDEALDHIAKHGTMHSECIVTGNEQHAALFLQNVDAAAVYHNASTRFTDGFEFGFGAEIGISTQKLHARGPMGLPALTSTKYIVRGSGQIRS